VLIRRVEVTMIALKRILVATDFSEPSAVAVNYGRDLGRAYDATLYLLHIVEDMFAFYAADAGLGLADVERNLEAAAQRDLDAEVARCDGDSLKVVAAVQRGSNVAQAITEYARTSDIDLIIVGTHGRGAVSRFLMGSVTERVIRSAPCPVLTVRAHERDFIDAITDAERETGKLVGANVTTTTSEAG
jgi:nucleotide-binding universal stress UspA family protein